MPDDAPDNATDTGSGTASGPAWRYTARLAEQIERSWQERWEAEGTFHAPNPAGPMAEPERVGGRPKLFVLDMFPYPSGAGLHVGHPLGYIGTDVYGRFKRMCGYNVLHALGYDSFGLPAEQHAIATGIHPRVNTEANIANMRRQLRRLGLAHDERRSISTTDPAYYRWTQWIFLQIFESWYDADAGRARPIAELVDELASGRRPTPDGQPWDELEASEQRSIVDGHRLAYLSDAPVNWCPGLGTILANEEVTAEGRSDIGNYPVFKKSMRQWTMRITAYAERLLDDLDRLDWPEPIKLMQRNWIGRSTGAEVRFATAAGPVTVFTTRPDTLFGATFLVLAPEHPLVAGVTTPEHAAAVDAYRAAAGAKRDVDRQDDSREKTGVFTGGFATNPVNGEQVPIWVADYVLMGYGTGAIMAVPCGDQRDFEFARAFGLDIRAIQIPPDEWFAGHGIEPSLDTSTWPEAFTDDAPYVASSNDTLTLDGISSVAEAVALVSDWLVEQGSGRATVTYRLRDWLFSRQRYWGEPFPVVYDGDVPVALPADQLPVLLPDLEDFKPQSLDPDDDVTDPIPPLARATHWTEVELDIGDGLRTYRREVNVMPQWAGSCWYELRYLDPTNDDAFVDPEVEQYWLGPSAAGHTGGVDLYVGGVEHAVLHLLYARFWHKVLFDLGHVSSEEPFHRLFNQGYIQAYAYRDERGQTVPAAEVTEAPDGGFAWQGQPVQREYGKMGKSLKNVVTPDEMYDEFGADTFRLYEMSMGPLEASRPWNTRDVIGMQRFLQRVWRNLVDEDSGASRVIDVAADDELRRLLHRTIEGVRADMDGLRFNTAISKLIELNNALTQVVPALGGTPREVAEPLALMLAPLAPHVGEELWQRLGHAGSLTYESFPVADPALLVAESVEVPVQVNGKVKARISVPADADAAAMEAIALADDRVQAAIGDRQVRKVIAVPVRTVSIVAP
jgi:leucyl-tRNA synthetase